MCVFYFLEREGGRFRARGQAPLHGPRAQKDDSGGFGRARKEISNEYKKKFYQTRIGAKSLKRLIESLSEAGLVYEDKDPNDKRAQL